MPNALLLLLCHRCLSEEILQLIQAILAAPTSSSSEVKWEDGKKDRRDRYRFRLAEVQGYYVRMMEIPRLEPNIPKCEILLGAKAGSLASTIIAQTDNSKYIEIFIFRRPTSEAI